MFANGKDEYDEVEFQDLINGFLRDLNVNDGTGVIVGNVLGYSSNYFEEDVSLQLEIRGVSWDYGESPEQDVSYEKKSIGDLSEEMELLGMELDADTGDSCEFDMVEDGEEQWILTYTISNYREGMCKFSWGKEEDIILEKPIVVRVK